MSIYLLAFLLLPSTAVAQVVAEMTPERIREAIKAGTEKGIEPYKIRSGPAGLSPVWGTYWTPWLRVAFAASEAKRTYKTFTEPDAAGLIAPELEVYGEAFDAVGQKAVGHGIVSVDAIVIKTPAGQVLQPIRSEPIMETFKNRSGGEFEGRSLRAWFPLSVVAEGNEIVLVLSSGKEIKSRLKPDKMK